MEEITMTSKAHHQKKIPPYKRRGEAPSAQRLPSVCLAPTTNRPMAICPGQVWTTVKDYFLPSFTYGLGMITRCPDRATSSGCPAGRMSLPTGCSPPESEGGNPHSPP